MNFRDEHFDMTNIRYVKRVIIGTSDPRKLQDDDFIEKQAEFLNRCLNDTPRGVIIGQEKNFNLIRLGEQQVVLQNIVYHIGFARKPLWIESMAKS